MEEKINSEEKISIEEYEADVATEDEKTNTTEKPPVMELVLPIVLLVVAGGIGGILWPVLGGAFIGMMNMARKNGDRRAAKRNSLIASAIGVAGIAVNLIAVLLMS